MAAIESLTTEAIIALVNAGTWPTTFQPTVGNLMAVGETLVVDVSSASNVLLHMKNDGNVTMSAGVFVVEGSIDSTTGADGTWFAIQTVRSNANTVESQTSISALTAGSGNPYALEASVNAVKWVRIRCTTAVTAGAIGRWTIIRGAYATEPIPAIQTHPVTASGTFVTSPLAGSAHTQIAAATTNITVVKSSAGNLNELTMFNMTGAVVYIKLYNKATAPVLATDVPVMVLNAFALTPIIYTWGELGKRFPLGISIAITANPTTNDATAIGAGGVLVSATYS